MPLLLEGEEPGYAKFLCKNSPFARRPDRLVSAAGHQNLSLTMEVRIYRQRPETARHVKPGVQTLWDFLGAQGQP